MLPDFYDGENLPEGNHPCTWEDFVVRFAYNDHRRVLLERLSHVMATAKHCDFLFAVIFGSYITSKEAPGDVDIVWVLSEAVRTEELPNRCKQLLEHDRSKERFGCDLWYFTDSEGFLNRINTLWGFTRDYPKKRGLVIITLADYEL